jgi:hypothetical protein
MQFSLEYLLPVAFILAIFGAFAHLRHEKKKVTQERQRKRLRGIEVIVEDSDFSNLRGKAFSEPDYQNAETRFLQAVGGRQERGSIERTYSIRLRP